MTPEERTLLKQHLDDPSLVLGCSCGCFHFIGLDTLQRPEVLFRCAHLEHRLDGSERVYLNPPHNGAVLVAESLAQAGPETYVAPLATTVAQ